MTSKRFDPEKDLAPMPFDKRICRQALEMKKTGLEWRPQVGCFVWDPDEYIKPASPFPGRIYFILSLARFIDIFDTIEEMAEKLVWLPTWHQARLVCRQLGIGVAITDHNEIRGAEKIAAEDGVLSIPGIEMTSAEGTHILIYFYQLDHLETFYNDHVMPNLGNDIMSSTALEMEEIIKRARKFNSIIIFPHPYCGVYTGIQNSYFSEDRRERLFSMIDGVEVINAENMKISNLRSAVLGFNLDKGITGGSDGHRTAQMGRVVTYAKCRHNRKAFLDAIKEMKLKKLKKLLKGAEVTVNIHFKDNN